MIQTLTLIDLVDEHIDTERRHTFKQEQIQLILKLCLQKILHSDLLSSHDRVIWQWDIRRRHLEREDADLIRGNDDRDIIEHSRRDLVYPQKDALSKVS